ncbi:MAG: NAD-dependent succinate-semialdehyde dehydrogenase [Gluconacetobacter liquefaciens]
MTDYPDTRLFIEGAWYNAANGRTLPVFNPATGAQIGKVAHAGLSDMERAAAGAAHGFARWRAMTAWERCTIMRRAADLLRARAETIGRIMTIEQGKPVAEAVLEVVNAANIIDYFAEETRRLDGSLIPARVAGVEQRVQRQPIGVVAAFTPWNFPINQIARKLGAALGAGCAIIVKAPENTPASPAALIEALADASVPAGTVSLLFGTPAEISEYLIAHPTVRKISFTGSTAVGKHLAALAGAQMKPVTMELGGHAPAIVCADADLDQAVERLCAAKFRNAGQVCVAPTRFLLHRSIADTFLARFKETMERIVIGDGLLPGTTMGPLIDQRRVTAMHALLDDARTKGAQVLSGGDALAGQGNFFAPTLLTNLNHSMRLMQDEPFGPIALAIPFDTLPEAIAEANRLPYGLAAYAYTQCERTQRILGEQIESGMVSINHHGIGVPEVPFGGIKDSGYGTEGGPEAIRAHTTIKLVSTQRTETIF